MTRRILPFLTVTLAAVTCVVLGSPAARSDVDCAPRTAWAGSETVTQYDTGTMVQIPATTPITLTHLTVSLGFAQHTPGYAELLLMAGVSDTPVSLHGREFAVLPADPSFGPLQVDTGASGHNENPVMSGGVIASRIYKTTDGAGNGLVDVDTQATVPAGGVLWVHYDSVSTAPTDPEVQVVATYTRAGC